MTRWIQLALSFTLAIAQLCGCNRSTAHNSDSAKAGDDKSELTAQKVTEPPNSFGFAKVKFRDGDVYKEGIVDRDQKEIVPLLSSLLVEDIADDLALIRMERKFLFVPLANGPVSAEDLEGVNGFQYATPYSCGVALVVVDDVWFYIAHDGQPAFSDRFDFAESFHEDRAYVKLGNEHRIIDPTGRVVAKLDYQEVSLQSPYCWQVSDKENGHYRTGFVDLNGAPISGLVYDRIGYYDPEVKRIWVMQNDRYGFVDEFGKVVIPIQYEYAEIFNHGKARVELNGRVFFIDRDGNEVND